MSWRFLHVGFQFEGAPKITEMKQVFERAKDWMRYAPNCWIIWTNESPETWFQRLKPQMGKGDTVLICAINLTERRGWLSKELWDWIQKERSV